MILTEERKKELVEGLQQHDFTRDIPISGNMKIPDAQAETYVKIKDRVLGYMKSNLRDLGIKRDGGNFSKEFPVNLLMNADAGYIAKAATDIIEDEEQTVAAVEQYLEWFEPMIEYAMNSFCNAKGKTPEELTEEDMQRIVNRVVEVGNEQLTSLLLMGQQMPGINEVAHTAPAHDDFGTKRNVDSINFYNKWTHNKTKTGAMLSLENEVLPETPYEEDHIDRMKIEAFYQTLNDADETILRMRESRQPYKKIAEVLGYKTHSAVKKRVEKLQDKWIEFNREYESNT